ncbi:hypothetical protein BOVAC1_4948 [Bacteroides ovatus]|uniref:Uncharacterized protein n=1 Tax=Bacteroides ovatus (strain ATCC 8483 / DSM 1896 / JCM 5824 / BCRC 10623 / CCUG 4943 / NCTC 11153) TaxID=411476 RepID=A0AAN3ACM4_BACO1|nr:hypothetical protein BACOVA_01087 [Bacteroides ovatus ATCC 8483]CAG9870593.1 hypothetical protein BOVAC1_4948 [Bacteroides ovatus]CAG9897631.1 hypothetical protein BOVA713_2795 [Bacteroides ovatus]CAG9929141.1 hypothetical protein BOVA208_3643 [Bacteroides ovatus]
MIDVFIVYVSFFKRRVKVCFIIGLSKYIIFSLLESSYVLSLALAINRKLPFFPMQSFFRLIEKFLLTVCNL